MPGHIARARSCKPSSVQGRSRSSGCPRRWRRGVTHRWTRLEDYIAEPSNERIRARIHYRFSTARGTQMGRKIGEYTVPNYLRPVTPLTDGIRDDTSPSGPDIPGHRLRYRLRYSLRILSAHSVRATSVGGTANVAFLPTRSASRT